MRALLIVDVQNDFCEGGALGVDGGQAVAQGITSYLEQHAGDYDVIMASRDWHDPDNDNGGHFAPAGKAPNFVTTWHVHCVARTTGAVYHPTLDTSSLTHQIKKGQGIPAYSLFEGVSDDGQTAKDVLENAGVTSVDVVGIATDHCVLASSKDAVALGFDVRVLDDLIAAVSPTAGEAALSDLAAQGARVESSSSS